MKIGPIGADHHEVGQLCTVCKKPFKEGDALTLIPLGPGDDETDRANARAGRAYNSVAAVAHYECSYLAYQ